MNFAKFAVIFHICVLFVACGGLDNNIKSPNENEVSQATDNDEKRSGNESSAGWTNINKELDMALQMIWPVMVERNYTSFELPNMTESLSLKPLFITYTARLWLTNGLLFNIDGISRNGDAMMTYHNKSFQFRANLVVRNVEFVYDYKLRVIAVGVRGKVGGSVQNVILTGDFTIGAEDANIRLNHFQVVSYNNIEIRLKHNSILKDLSGSILRPISEMFKDRIITIVSDAVRIKLDKLIDDINQNDRLHFKQFGRVALAGLVGQATLQ